MPWRQVDAITERRQVIVDARQRLVTFTDLCALYGISRVTGYKWLARANASGLDYLQELTRRPHTCPDATPPVLQARLIERGGGSRRGGLASCWRRGAAGCGGAIRAGRSRR